MRAYGNYLQDDWVHWLPLAEFTYNISVHASTSVTLLITEKGAHPSIKTTIWAIPADGSISDMLDTKAQAEKLVELWDAIEQC